MRQQQTLRKSVSINGIGLHSGKRVSLELRPARANTGIKFVRGDLSEAVEIPATVAFVQSTTLATTIGKDSARISTIEHLMSALWAMGIDNALCIVEGEEVPILDGSAVLFAELICKSGIKRQRAPRKYIKALRPIELREGNKWALLNPAEEFSLHYTIDFPHPSIGRQEFRFDSDTDFLKEVAPARTFGFLKDVERMQSMGLALGGSLSNAVVLDEEKAINPEGLRFKDEFVRHKVLDALGDLSLLGLPLLASIELHRAGHELQTRIIQALLADPSAYQIVSFVEVKGQSSEPALEEETSAELFAAYSTA
jgi:UDP-3-O-[3-hydroxymyristoyl] N-acetylglucosamine deacetylase